MKCKQCGNEFVSKREDATLCSPKCRKAYSRTQLSVTSVTDNSKADVTDKVSVTETKSQIFLKFSEMTQEQKTCVLYTMSACKITMDEAVKITNETYNE